MLMILSGAIVAFAPNFPVMLVGRVLVGVALGGFWSLSAATAMRLVPARSVPKALAVVNSGPALASTIAAPLGSFIGGLLGWRGAFISFIPLAVAALAWMAISLPSLPARRHKDAGSMIDLLRKPGVAHGYLGGLLFFAGTFWLFTYLRPFLEQVTHVSGAQLSCVLLIVGIAGFVGTSLIGRAIGERLHLTLATLPGMLAVVAVGLATYGHSLPATGALLAIWGLVSTAAPVVWWTWVTRTAPNNAEAGGGLMVAVAQIGICAGAGGGGVIFDGYGPVATFIGSAVLLVVAALVALTIGGRSRVCGGARNDVCTSAHAVAP
jgi:predicted MFS family arabinose efflux permease